MPGVCEQIRIDRMDGRSGARGPLYRCFGRAAAGVPVSKSTVHAYPDDAVEFCFKTRTG